MPKVKHIKQTLGQLSLLSLIVSTGCSSSRLAFPATTAAMHVVMVVATLVFMEVVTVMGVAQTSIQLIVIVG